MKALSIDIETLGTLVDSQILSIGLAIFNLKTGKVFNSLYITIKLDINKHVNATPSTIAFWTKQAIDNPAALKGLFSSKDIKAVGMVEALQMIQTFCNINKPKTVWANSPKFDLSMLEYQFQQNDIKVPWGFNADRCMRTLRQFAGKIDVEMEGIQHNALSDAIWQAKYISFACNKLKLV